MLVKLDVENFRSIKNRVTFHTLQRNYKRFTEHVFKYNDTLSILKTSGIYGSNGSGKSNLFKALYFVKQLVENGNFLNTTEAIKNFTPFKLDKNSSKKPIVVELDFITENNVYIYKIAIDVASRKIIEEQLTRIGGNEQIIFKRNLNVLEFPSNQLYNELRDQFSRILEPSATVLSFDIIKDEDIDAARVWFKDKVEFLFPTYEFDDIAYIFTRRKEYLNLANDIIKSSNVGIDKLELVRVPINIFLGLDSKELIREITTILEKKTHHSFKDNFGNFCTAIKDENDEIVVVKLVCIHNNADGHPVEFDVDQESRGTIVLLHLIPALIRSFGEGVNYFIDDINTSLHPILLKEILGQYLSFNLGEAKGQLIFNSHEDFLMDEKIVRQDELWLMEKKDGVSDLFPLSDFANIRFDLNLRKNYLNGNFGGVPFKSQPKKLNFGGK